MSATRSGFAPAASDGVAAGARPVRARRGRTAFLLLAALCCAVFSALGVWQVQRLAWKKDLVARVDARIHADPVRLPALAHVTDADAREHEYTRIRIEGRWLGEADTRVQAVTRLGAGWWLLRPLRSDSGVVVLVNRGFVPAGDAIEFRKQANGERASVTGLLRMDEPGGGFLRRNDPGAGRWFSRDVHAIAQVYETESAASFFVDAEHAGAADSWPAGGLTVTRFADNHLSYALTWFTLALLAAGGGWRVLREPAGRRRIRNEGAIGVADRYRADGGSA